MLSKYSSQIIALVCGAIISLISGISSAEKPLPADPPTEYKGNKNCQVYMFPIYPRKAQRRGVEGWVLLNFTIEKSGKLKNANILEASPEGYFEKATLSMVNSYNMRSKPLAFDNSLLKLEESAPKPRMENGEAVEIPGCVLLVEYNLG